MTDSPRIYVASLTDYNAGRLHGAWIDCDEGPDAIWEAVRAMLAASPEARSFPEGGPAEEYAIHDFEGWHGIRWDEMANLDQVAEVGELLAEHGAAFAAWYDDDDRLGDLGDLGNQFEDAYRGEWGSIGDYAEQFCADVGTDIPEHLAMYVDFEAMGRDWIYGGDLWTADADGGGVYVFSAY